MSTVAVAVTQPGHSGPRSRSANSPLSLRARLTLWIVLTFLFVYLSLALLYQLYHSRAIEELFTNGLRSRLTLLIEDVQSRMPGLTDAELVEFNRQQVRSEDFVCSVRDLSGTPIASTRRPVIQFEPAQIRAATQTSEPLMFMRRASDLPGNYPDPDMPARTMIQAFTGADGGRYLAVIGRVDTLAQQMHRVVTRILLFGIPIGIVAMGVSAYIIAGAAIRPLAAISEFARGMSPESIENQPEFSAAPSEVAAIQRELEMARQRIEAGFKSQERFMSNVSHELKTPISVILTELQALKLDHAPAPVRDALRSTYEELWRLAKTVDSFLLLTRVRHGKTRIPSAETCLVRDVLVESYASCSSMAAQYKVSIQLRLPEGNDSDAAVIGNCDLLAVIFDNIIRNAIRFSPVGERVVVEERVDQQHVFVTIRDFGPGIPVDLLSRIFDRFAQSRDEERRGRGHGLGLEIAAGIVELHGGSIEVQNREPTGCEFTVRLPRYSLNVDCSSCADNSSSA